MLELAMNEMNLEMASRLLKAAKVAVVAECSECARQYDASAFRSCHLVVAESGPRPEMRMCRCGHLMMVAEVLDG